METTKKELRQQLFEGERALFEESNLAIYDSIFDNGESPLKESCHIDLFDSMFRWKYPLWYCNDIYAKDCTWFNMARAGVWYSNDVRVEDAIIEAPKNFRRCDRLSLKNVTFVNAEETLWNCKNVTMDHVTAKGDYILMNCENLNVDGFHLVGNYSFDGCKNVEVHNSRLISKDAFWNCENVTVYDSFITGEYIAWNSKNVTFINCTIESLQGLCYVENLKMVNCKLIHTTYAFERSTADAEITTPVDSVLDPYAGVIKAPVIKKLYYSPQFEEADLPLPNIEAEVLEILHEMPAMDS